jgi:hypothetical protein
VPFFVVCPCTCTEPLVLELDDEPDDLEWLCELLLCDPELLLVWELDPLELECPLPPRPIASEGVNKLAAATTTPRTNIRQRNTGPSFCDAGDETGRAVKYPSNLTG